MAITECGYGHLYDTDQYAACPYCNGGGNVINFGAAPSSPEGIGKTAPVAGGFGASPGNAGASPGNNTPGGASNIGVTVAPESYRKKEREENKTVAIVEKKLKVNQPIVGWLVCIEGPEKGKDYQIQAKNNTIGRSGKMDICIREDMTISRENHARLAYDEKHNNFHLIPAENTNNIYLNDEPVYIPTKLEAYDCIEFGDSKMVFIPFCSTRFTWKDGLVPKGD